MMYRCVVGSWGRGGGGRNLIDKCFGVSTAMRSVVVVRGWDRQRKALLQCCSACFILPEKAWLNSLRVSSTCMWDRRLTNGLEAWQESILWSCFFDSIICCGCSHSWLPVFGVNQSGSSYTSRCPTTISPVSLLYLLHVVQHRVSRVQYSGWIEGLTRFITSVWGSGCLISRLTV